MKIFSQSQKYSVAAPRHPRGVGPRLEPVSGGGVHEVAGSPREVDLGGGEPVHVGDDGAGPGDVERGLAAPEQRRDGGHVRLRLPGRQADNWRVLYCMYPYDLVIACAQHYLL